jgi:hypothetical protein
VKPQYTDVPTGDLATLRRELLRFSQLFGDIAGSHDLGLQEIGTAETQVAHGLGRPPARWLATNHDQFALVVQTRNADERFLFLAATADVTCALVVW